MAVSLVGPPGDARGAHLVDRRRLAARARRMLRALGCADAELSVSLVDDAAIRELNREWRGRDRATDVLSFSLLEGEHDDRRGRLLGDVVISVETAARQARSRHRSLDDTLARLLVHGLLHVVGHDHELPHEARRMAAEERRLWRVAKT